MSAEVIETMLAGWGVEDPGQRTAELMTYIAGETNPFPVAPGIKQLAGCYHDGQEAGAQAVAKVLMMVVGQMGLGEDFLLSEHPTEDVVYVGVAIEKAPPQPELLVPEKVLIIPGQRPISGGSLHIP